MIMKMIDNVCFKEIDLKIKNQTHKIKGTFGLLSKMTMDMSLE